MTAIDKVPDGQPDEPLAYLVVAEDGGPERSVPIFDQLFVGRECAGISEPRRLVIPDPEISRTHLEIRLDVAGDQAFVIDTSTNGTLRNGVRLAGQGVSPPITPLAVSPENVPNARVRRPRVLILVAAQDIPRHRGVGAHDCRHILIVVDRCQPCAAASAALNVLLGRITAVVMSRSGA